MLKNVYEILHEFETAKTEVDNANKNTKAENWILFLIITCCFYCCFTSLDLKYSTIFLSNLAAIAA